MSWYGHRAPNGIPLAAKMVQTELIFPISMPKSPISHQKYQ